MIQYNLVRMVPNFFVFTTRWIWAALIDRERKESSLLIALCRKKLRCTLVFVDAPDNYSKELIMPKFGAGLLVILGSKNCCAQNLFILSISHYSCAEPRKPSYLCSSFAIICSRVGLPMDWATMGSGCMTFHLVMIRWYILTMRGNVW